MECSSESCRGDRFIFGKKALIVTGRHSSKQNGSLADVMAALETCGTEYIVYDRIEENPPSQRLWMQPGSAGNRAQIL